MDGRPIGEMITALGAMQGSTIANVIAFLAAMVASWAAWESGAMLH